MENEIYSHIDTPLIAIVNEALNDGIFPGATVGFLIDNEKNKGKRSWAFGFTDNSRKDEVEISTYYDLASLTKPFVTVLSLLVLFEKTNIGLKTNINKLIQSHIPYDKSKISLGDLMAHRSGLPGYRPYFKELLNIEGAMARKKKAVEYILHEDLVYKTGSSHLYSDLGFILLGEIVEEISKEPLDLFWMKEVLNPLNIQNGFIFSPEKNNICDKYLAATEKCPWSGKMLKGIVHDENCRVLGGVAGHAGLFGTIEGVLDLCGHLLRQWKGREDHPHYSSEKLRKILCRNNHSNWCYGFDTPAKIYSSSGKYFSYQSVGHLGFTGTSFWIDLSRGIVIALLTNRVHPNRENEGIKKFRPMLHDTIMKQIVDV